MKQLIGKLKASYELECSPVAYTAALVEQVLTTDMDLLTFRNQLKQQTKSAQFYFFRMPEADIKQNQRVFAQEFQFADALNKLAEASRSMTQEEFRRELCRCAEKYLSSRAQV